MRKWIALFLVILVALNFSGIVSAESDGESLEEKYRMGQILLSQDRFAEAGAVFSQLGGYEDATKLTMYCKAVMAGEEGRYADSFMAFNVLGDYKDSEIMMIYFNGRWNESIAEDKQEGILYCRYLNAAIEEYQKVTFFRDTEERIEKCRSAIYEEAGRIEQTGNLLAAEEIYYGLYNYRDSNEKALAVLMKEYDLGIQEKKEVSTEGFGGDVTVRLALDGSKVLLMWIEAFDETLGLGQKVMEEEFVNQFIGKQGPFTYGENGIDAVAGATQTSQAVLKAINEAITGQEAGNEVNLSDDTPDPFAEGIPKDTEYIGSAEGFISDVTVILTLNDDRTVASLSIDAGSEVAGMGQKVMEEEFINQFIGKTGPFIFGTNGIDAVSGVTITSNAVLQAINSALGFE